MSEKIIWYTYVDDLNMRICDDEGQLFKCVNEGTIPITLSLYMSEELVKKNK